MLGDHCVICFMGICFYGQEWHQEAERLVNCHGAMDLACIFVTTTRCVSVKLKTTEVIKLKHRH